MFTNSGMVQFKDVFLGTDKRPYVRAASVQACLRAGGKHNDWKTWATPPATTPSSRCWATGVWRLLQARQPEVGLGAADPGLQAAAREADWVTVYIDDDEAYDIWTQEIGLPPERVIRIGDNKGGKYASDNFWMMADTGPCGPCSEIFYDHGDHIPGGPPGQPG